MIKWFSANQLDLNLNKTNIMKFITNNTEILCITLTVEHNYISLSTVGKYNNYMFPP